MRRLLRSFSILLALAAFPLHRLSAQEHLVTVPIDSGTLVRMSPRSGPPFRGRLLETFTASDSTLHICSYPAPPCTSPTQVSAMQRISTASLAGLEVQHGNHLAEGAIIGGLIAGTVFGLLGGIAHSLCESSNCGPSTPGYITIGLVVGGMFGGLIGATSPKWTQAP